MPGQVIDRDSLSAVRICSLLDSLRALHEVRHSKPLRDALGEHVIALMREIIPAEKGSVKVGDVPAKDTQIFVSAMEGKRYRLTAPLLAGGEVAAAIVLERSDKSFSENELLVISAISKMASLALENARHLQSLEDEVQRLRRDLQFEDNMAGSSACLERLRRDIRRVAIRNTTVLVIGESGTGKELVARSIHGQSPRAGAAFIAINCAALSDTLLESELFGHEKGAFTGAVGMKRGLLEAAQGGTIFLDEIGEMAGSAQAKLLRVLQNRELQRVGGTATIPLDVRVVAATNRDLEAAVRRGTFREDLFYRLNVVTLRTPALRDRPEDIIPLAEYFADRFAHRCGRPRLVLAPGARTVLQSYDWPGNVRELENAIEHAVVLGSGDSILPEDLPDKLLERWAEVSPEETGMLQRAINSAKRTTVKRAFEMAQGDHAEAARLLGVHPNYLYRLLKNLNLPV